MTRLLTPSERRRLAAAVLHWLAPTALAASELASLTGQPRAAIQSVLVQLAGRGIVEPVDRVMTAAGVEHVWRLSEHGRFHDPRARLPGVPRCRHCRRIYRF